MLGTICASAQNIAEKFINMPDTILPYLFTQERKDLIELKKMEPDSTASVNAPLGKIEMIRLTDNILSLRLSEHNSLEMGMISPDTLYVIKTYGAPLQESVCTLYNNIWKKIRTFDFANTDFKDCSELIEFPLVSATIGNTPYELMLQLNIPLLTQEDKEKSKSKTMQRNVKWNGQTFN